MARRIISEVKLNDFESKFPDESGQLGEISRLIEQQQKDLKDYISRIESAHDDLEKLGKTKEILISEISNLEDSKEGLRAKLKRDSEPLEQEIENKKKELEDMKAKVESEKELSDKKNREFKEKTKTEESDYLALTGSHGKEIKILNEERDLIKKNIDIFNQELLKLKEEAVRINESLRLADGQLQGGLKQVKEIQDKISDLNKEVDVKNDEIKELDKKKIDLVNQTKKIEEDNLARIKQIEEQHKKELKELEAEKSAKKSGLKEVADLLEKENLKLEKVKIEYNKIMGMISGFISKKNEVERKETIIKKKYEEAGFSW